MTDPRLLVVAPRFPLPLESGTQLRIYHTLAGLAEHFDVTVVALVQDGEGRDRVADVEALGVDVYTVAHSRSKRDALLRYGLTRRPYRTLKFVTDEFRREVGRLLAEHTFDCVWVHFLTTLPVLPPDVTAPVVLDQHNADRRYWESFDDGGAGERLFARVNRWKLRRLQRRWEDRLDAVLSVSEADAVATRRWADCPVWTVPNGVDLDRFSPTRPAADAAPRALFVGSLDVRMNVEAVEWFVEDAWPTVRARHPGATFHVVGRNPTPAVESLDDRSGVTVVGHVPEVVSHYDEAAAVVAPFRLGGGTKLKVLEALAMERPLVATPTGVTGIDVADGTHTLVRDRTEGFADAVADLLGDPERRARLGVRGRSFVADGFAWPALVDGAIAKIQTHVIRDSD